MNGEIITKAALSRELKVTPPRIAQYIKSGMPTREDGRLNRDEVLSWLALFKVSGRDRKKGPALAAGLLNEKPVEVEEEHAPHRAAVHFSAAARRWTEIERAHVAAVECVLAGFEEPIARAALEAGIPIAQVANMLDIARLDLVGIGDDALAKLGVPGFASGDCNLTGLWPKVDMRSLADEIGEHFVESDVIALRKKTPLWRDSSVFPSRRDAE